MLDFHLRYPKPATPKPQSLKFHYWILPALNQSLMAEFERDSYLQEQSFSESGRGYGGSSKLTSA